VQALHPVPESRNRLLHRHILALPVAIFTPATANCLGMTSGYGYIGIKHSL